MSNWNPYTAPNMGLLFYKSLYSEVIKKSKNILQLTNEGNIEKLIFKIDEKKSEFIDLYMDLYNKPIKEYKIRSNIPEANSFTLYTTYPGLLIGSGYTHNTNTTGDATIGFYFDHTTGLPTIPGSSVKGILRSLFEIDIIEDRKGNKKEVTGEKSVKAITFILKEVAANTKEDKIKTEIDIIIKSLTDENLEKFKIELFGNNDETGADVFYDAAINIEKTTKTKFIGNDSITPHGDNPLKNPTPLQFLKVLPNIGFLFNLKIKESIVFNLSVCAKLEFYKTILLTIGAGAKTNVGYGQLSNEIFEDLIDNTPLQFEEKEPRNNDNNRSRHTKVEAPTRHEQMVKQNENKSRIKNVMNEFTIASIKKDTIIKGIVMEKPETNSVKLKFSFLNETNKILSVIIHNYENLKINDVVDVIAATDYFNSLNVKFKR
jgi:CRISPR-associated protein Cmr6